MDGQEKKNMYPITAILILRSAKRGWCVKLYKIVYFFFYFFFWGGKIQSSRTKEKPENTTN